MKKADLASYLDAQDLTQSAFARLAGVSTMTVSRAVNGKPIARASIRKMIAASDGKISLETFFPEVAA